MMCPKPTNNTVLSMNKRPMGLNALTQIPMKGSLGGLVIQIKQHMYFFNFKAVIASA